MRITVAVDIDRPPADVWADLSHIDRHVDWMADAVAIEFTSEQRQGVGVTFDTTTRIGPFTTTDRMRVTEWEDGRVIGVRHEGAVTGEGRFVLEPRADGTGTHFEWSEELRLPWYFGGRPGELVAAPLLRAFWRRNLKRFQRRLESRPPAEPPAADSQPGPLVGTGRDTEIREYGPGWVIRVARDGRSLAAERRVMEDAAAAGYPVPALAPGDDPSAIVMERLDGPSMLDDLGRQPWRSGRHARTLAPRQHDIARVQVEVQQRGASADGAGGRRTVDFAQPAVQARPADRSGRRSWPASGTTSPAAFSRMPGDRRRRPCVAPPTSGCSTATCSTASATPCSPSPGPTGLRSEPLVLWTERLAITRIRVHRNARRPSMDASHRRGLARRTGPLDRPVVSCT